MRNVTIAAAAAIATLSSVAAHAATIVPTVVSFSGSYDGYPATDAVDADAGFAISDWSSASQGANAFLNLDLGGVYTVASADVTDRVTSGGPNNVFVGGTYDFTTAFSLQFFTNASFTTAASQLFNFTRALPGSNPAPASAFLTVADLEGTTGQYVQYRVVASQGANAGLSNISFNAVPEPATWALMITGFGATGLMLRRRRTLATAATA